MTASNGDSAPIDSSLYIFPPNSPAPSLRGGKCQQCGFVVWPRQGACPDCFSTKIDDLPLSTRGRVWSSTVVRQGPGDYKGPVPYAVGIVELPEGVGVRTVFTEIEGDEILPIGTEVELVFDEVPGEGEDRTIGHKFRPIR